MNTAPDTMRDVRRRKCLLPAALAFTLVEILAALAIIAVVVSIIIPVVGSVRRSSQGTHCAANMRQIGAALLLYGTENGGRLPGPLWAEQGVVYRSKDGEIVNEGHLISYLAPYLGGVNEPDGWTNARNIDAFLCPAWLSQRGYDSNQFVGRAVLYQAEQRYFGVAKADVSLATQPKMFSDVPYPSRIAALFETDCQDGTYYGNTGNERLAVEPVHGDYRHYLFFDGSVQAVALDDQAEQQKRQRLQ